MINGFSSRALKGLDLCSFAVDYFVGTAFAFLDEVLRLEAIGIIEVAFSSADIARSISLIPFMCTLIPPVLTVIALRPKFFSTLSIKCLLLPRNVTATILPPLKVIMSGSWDKT
jgi:hypothetical protein